MRFPHVGQFIITPIMVSKDNFYIFSLAKDILDFEYMGNEYMELKAKEKEILKSLAKAPKTEYELSKKKKVRVASSSTVWKAIKNLKRLGLIELKSEERFPKIPRKIKKYYGLTFRGLVYALKLENDKGEKLKLSKISYWQDIISSWVQNAKILDSLIKIREYLKLEKEIPFEMLERELIDYIKNNQEQIEAFLRHYDLEFSDDNLICMELYIFIMCMKIASTLTHEEREKIEKIMNQIPEPYKMMFLIPDIWQTSMEMMKK